jgi:hypothetical protein
MIGWTRGTRSCSSRSGSGRRRCPTASTRCRTRPDSAAANPGPRRRSARSRPRAAGAACAWSTRRWSGAVDLIGAARQAIADPFLPRKIADGRLDEIRECTGSNVCILREEAFRHVGCVQNATAGEEYRRGWHPEVFSPAANAEEPVLVVGAGPAGRECAIVLGKRGFTAVHLIEAEAEIGGRLRWTRRLPTLGDWGRIVDWRPRIHGPPRGWAPGMSDGHGPFPARIHGPPRAWAPGMSDCPFLERMVRADCRWPGSASNEPIGAANSRDQGSP